MEENKTTEKKNVENEPKDPIVDINIAGQVELPSIDITPYIGKKANIELITTHQGIHGYYVKVVTEVIAIVDEVEIRASKILGLYTDNDGLIGWGEKTVTGLFLKSMKVEKIEDLKGKEVYVRKHITKQGKEFLTFD